MCLALYLSILPRQPLKENRFRIPKSRYDSVDLYLSTDWINRPEYNDTSVPYDEDIYKRLTKGNGRFRVLGRFLEN
jgi:hypothetical protein